MREQLPLEDGIRAKIGGVYRTTTGDSINPDLLSVDRLSGGLTNSGVFRARTMTPTGEWSVIVKITGLPDETVTPGDWRREIDAYRSGDLFDLASGLRAPMCYQGEDQPDGSTWLWLEDIHDSQEHWALTDYSRAAYQLGRFNGTYLAGRRMPSGSWLSRGWLRTQIEASINFIAILIENRNHPLIRLGYPPDVMDFVLESWRDREQYLSLLEHLPKTFCHMDAFRRNLFWSPRFGADVELVAIDWSFAGEGAIGVELVPLVGASVSLGEVEMENLIPLEANALSSYAYGLRDAGWRGNANDVWVGYAADAALRYGVGLLWFFLPIWLNESRCAAIEQATGRSLPDMVDNWGQCVRRISVRLGSEVRANYL